MAKAQVFTVARIFEGEIKETDLKLEEEELPPIEDGEFLAENLYLSVDPYMRAFANSYTVGQVMVGAQVAKVIESKNPVFPVGAVIHGNLGWRTLTLVKQDQQDVKVLPNLETISSSVALGVLGAPGATAYFGLLEICKPIEGDTVVVSGAGGAVGSHVGQIALIKKCKVIGITGSDEKAKWLKSLGFHFVINYKKTKDLKEELKKEAPKGIDCYFDNVGGEISTAVLQQMNAGGRVAVCGSISAYNARIPLRAEIVQPAILSKQLTLQGFTGRQFQDRFSEAFDQNLQWIKEHKVKPRETMTDGFENATKALIGVMKGENAGKAIVRVKGSLVQNESLDFSNSLNFFKKSQARK